MEGSCSCSRGRLEGQWRCACSSEEQSLLWHVSCFAGCVSSGVRLKSRGQIRLGPGKKIMKYDAEKKQFSVRSWLCIFRNSAAAVLCMHRCNLTAAC